MNIRASYIHMISPNEETYITEKTMALCLLREVTVFFCSASFGLLLFLFDGFEISFLFPMTVSLALWRPKKSKIQRIPRIATITLFSTKVVHKIQYFILLGQ